MKKDKHLIETDEAVLLERKRIKKRNKKINQSLIIVSLALMAVTVLFMGYNLITVMTHSSKGSGEVLQSDTVREKNDLYEIGNNPTQIYQDYFKELTTAVNDNDDEAIASAVVKCFIADYFTWTNKDGNYDVGGSQYIYGEKALSFIEQSRWQFYKDLDLYIEEYGRDQLLEVESVTINSIAYTPHDDRRVNDGYYVEASWTYKQGGKLDTSDFQDEGFFYVTKPESGGRYEIVNFASSWVTYTEDLNAAYDL